MQPELVEKIQIPIFNNQAKRLIMANHSAKQLNLTNTGNYTGRFSSVESFLNVVKRLWAREKLNNNYYIQQQTAHF